MATELARIKAAIEKLQQQLQHVAADKTGRSLDPETLRASRDYARSCRDHSTQEVVEGCSRALRLYGFCVIDHVVPEQDIPRVRHEVVEATELIPRNNRAARVGDASAIRRPTRYPLLPGTEACHQVLFLPQLAEFLGHTAVTGVAREVLDDHIRIAQVNTRPIRADRPDSAIPWNRPSKPGFGSAGSDSDDSIDKSTWREWYIRMIWSTIAQHGPTHFCLVAGTPTGHTWCMAAPERVHHEKATWVASANETESRFPM